MDNNHGFSAFWLAMLGLDFVLNSLLLGLHQCFHPSYANLSYCANLYLQCIERDLHHTHLCSPRHHHKDTEKEEKIKIIRGIDPIFLWNFKEVYLFYLDGDTFSLFRTSEWLKRRARILCK